MAPIVSWIAVIFTDRVRSTMVRYCFHRCLSGHRGKGYPGQGTYPHPQPRYLPPGLVLTERGTPRYLPPPPPTGQVLTGGYPKVPNPWPRYLPPGQVQKGEGVPQSTYPQPRYLPPAKVPTPWPGQGRGGGTPR